MKRIPATTKKAKEAWKHIPLVKLGEILKPMIWFSGKYKLSPGKSDYKETYHKVMPRFARLDMQYRKKQIRIECIWETRETLHNPLGQEFYPDRFAIGILKPFHSNFQNRRCYVSNTIKYRYSRYYSTAIDKIEDAILDAQYVIDEEIADQEKVEKRRDEVGEAKERLCKKLDVKVTSDDTTLFYREENEYNLEFGLLENGFYEIDSVGGKYTEAEIKKMIKVIGGNPRAIAERLSK